MTVSLNSSCVLLAAVGHRDFDLADLWPLFDLEAKHDLLVRAEQLQHGQQLAIRTTVLFDRVIDAGAEHLRQDSPRGTQRGGM